MIQKWWVYMVKCADQTLYTGISTNVKKRVAKHNQAKGAKYTRGRTPVKLVYKLACTSKSQAAKKEYQIKQLSHQQKKQLINQFKKS